MLTDYSNDQQVQVPTPLLYPEGGPHMQNLDGKSSYQKDARRSPLHMYAKKEMSV